MPVGVNMKSLIWISAVAGLVFIAERSEAHVVRVDNVSIDIVAMPGPREVTVGVFLDVDSGADLILGGYDIPLDFGAAGTTSLPAGFSFNGVQDSIFTLQGTLGYVADPTGSGDHVVSDAPVPPTGVPPAFQTVTGGTTARLFNLRFGLDGTVQPGVELSISPFVTGGHPFFNLNDSLAVQITVASRVAGGLQTVPEPSSAMALGAISGLLYLVRRGRRR